jgi:ankyrin repeat protein
LFKQQVLEKNLDVKTLVQQSTIKNQNVLHFVCKYGDSLEYLNYFIENGADPNSKDYENNLPIHSAIKYNRLDLLAALFEKTDHDVSDKNLFHFASNNKSSLEIFSFLKEKQVDLNKKDSNG